MQCRNIVIRNRPRCYLTPDETCASITKGPYNSYSTMWHFHLVCGLLLCLTRYADSDIGKLVEVFSWNQITYNLNGMQLISDRIFESEDNTMHPPRNRSAHPSREEGKIREKRIRRQIEDRFNGLDGRSLDKVVFPEEEERNGWSESKYSCARLQKVEKWRNKLFVTTPRRRYGIPSTLNYIDLELDSGVKSPGLRPYPGNSRKWTKALVSVYRTRVDSCNRLWMVDTGLLEIPENREQVQPPAIVVFDLLADQEVLRYEFKSSDLVSERTAAGLASITVDVINNDCYNTFAYVPDLTTYGLIVFSLKERDSWRVNHNYFSFTPTAGDMRIADQSFSWNDGIFSLTLGPITHGSFRTAYFHPMVSFQEFSVSTEILRNQTLATRLYHGNDFKYVGERGPNSQSTMHAYDFNTGAILYAEVGRDAVTCWNVRNAPLTAERVFTLAQDPERLVYPSDLHITNGDLWIMTNKIPRFIYSTLDTRETNFRIFRGNVKDMISGTICEDIRYAQAQSGNPSADNAQTNEENNPVYT